MYVQLKKKKEALCPEQTRKEAAEESDPGLDFVSCIVLASILQKENLRDCIRGNWLSVTSACDGTVDGGQRAALRWVGNIVCDGVEVDGFLSNVAVHRRCTAGSATLGCSKCAEKGDNSSSVYKCSSMDGFKVACIFAKVEFV